MHPYQRPLNAGFSAAQLGSQHKGSTQQKQDSSLPRGTSLCHRLLWLVYLAILSHTTTREAGLYKYRAPFPCDSPHLGHSVPRLPGSDSENRPWLLLVTSQDNLTGNAADSIKHSQRLDSSAPNWMSHGAQRYSCVSMGSTLHHIAVTT